MENVPHLTALLKQLQQVPYLASKNLYRVAQYFLDLDAQRTDQFCKALREVKEHLVKCPTCWVWKERDVACSFCSSTRRDKKIVCVVETWQDVVIIEKAGGYHGVYHVLGGAICPLEGVGPDSLTIAPLIDRVAQGCTEIIFALSQTPEGEATASYIASKVVQGLNKDIKISCLARGLPVGASLEIMDRLTVFKALAERRPF